MCTADAWTGASPCIVEKGREQHKEVVFHTHCNPPNEITAITKAAMDKLFERGITVRNQTVLQRRVNDPGGAMKLLGKHLSPVNMHPHFIFIHDPVTRRGGPRPPPPTRPDLPKTLRPH